MDGVVSMELNMAVRAERRSQAAEVDIKVNSVSLKGDLAIPAGAKGIVLFAHGSGSSRRSSRNRFVAGTIQEKGIATLLFDLLTPEEEEIDLLTRRLRFDIGLLAKRLVGATNWIGAVEETRDLRVGYFGSSTGGGAALVAAAEMGEVVGAVVLRGGRPDLAGSALSRVRSPVLLIVGGHDTTVIRLNNEASEKMICENELKIIPNATHLFEEPGTLEDVAATAADWFNEKIG